MSYVILCLKLWARAAVAIGISTGISYTLSMSGLWPITVRNLAITGVLWISFGLSTVYFTQKEKFAFLTIAAGVYAYYSILWQTIFLGKVSEERHLRSTILQFAIATILFVIIWIIKQIHTERCTNCGDKLPKNARYCIKCRAPVAYIGKTRIL